MHSAKLESPDRIITGYHGYKAATPTTYEGLFHESRAPTGVTEPAGRHLEVGAGLRAIGDLCLGLTVNVSCY